MKTWISLKTVQWMVWGGLASLLIAIMTLSQVTLVRADEPLFGSPRNLAPFPYNTNSIVLGDLDGNGTLDLVVGNSGEPSLVYLNKNGDGNFAKGMPFGEKDQMDKLNLGDLDGNGTLDLIVENSEQQNVIYYNDGDGNFTKKRFFGPQNGTTTLVVGDIDGDGALDIITNNKIYWNDKYGNFTSEQTFGGDGTYMALGDLDNNNTLDLVVITSVSTIIYWNNGGRGHFTKETIEVEHDKLLRGIAIGDLDGDGKLDFINNMYSYWNQGNRIFNKLENKKNLFTNNPILADIDKNGILDIIGSSNVYLNNHFDKNQSIGVDNLTDIIALGDLDGNGFLDLIVGDFNKPNRVYLDKHQSTFKEGPSYPESNIFLGNILGDLDGDGRLDLVVNNNIYLNNGSGYFEKKHFLESVTKPRVIVLGDLDGNSSLDLIVSGFNSSNFIYLNNGNGTFTKGQSFGEKDDDTFSIALGDLDSNGSLDFIVGNTNSLGSIYLNNGNGIFTKKQSVGEKDDNTLSIAVGDIDSNGSLDFIMGNHDTYHDNKIYLNDGQANFVLKQSLDIGDNKNTTSIALGDLDGNDSLDLVIGSFNYPRIYFNDDKGNFKANQVFGGYQKKRITGITLTDLDNNGFLDILSIGYLEFNQLYLNDGHGNFEQGQPFWWENASWSENIRDNLLFGDLDGNGSNDLVVVGNTSQVYFSGYTSTNQIPNVFANVVISTTNQANGYSTSKVFNQRYIPITYTLFDDNPIGQIHVTYSMNGRGQWFTATASTDTITTNLATSLYPTRTITNTHVFTWDTLASGVFGRSDNVVVRIKACTQPTQPGPVGSFKYPNAVGGGYQQACATTTSYPFRVQGSQVRVLTGTQPISGAIVYRKPVDSGEAALPMAAMNQVPFTTDANGYLQGRGTLALSDTLVALVPVSATHYYTLYHTSAKPTTDGLEAYTIKQAGVQTLTVGAGNPLYLLSMTVSLEWDASHDKVYMAELQRNIQRTSEILYDLTNGGMALGSVKIYQAKEHWDEANVVIYANNSVRPHADLGGFVPKGQLLKDVFTNGLVITYTHGQVQLGAVWGRYGNSDGNLSEDWARVLAHELGHYYMTLLDNYLGINDKQVVVPIECEGTSMASPYQDDDSEFLMDWPNTCPREKTVTPLLKISMGGLTEWDMILRRFPALAPLKPLSRVDKPGPATLPLQVTQIEMITPTGTAKLLDAPFFDLKSATSEAIFPRDGQAKGYLVKTQDNNDMTDDVIIELGSPTQDTLLARGAAVHDDVCLFDYSQPVMRFGCQPINSVNDSKLKLQQDENWPPYIIITPELTQTYIITVIANSKVYRHSTFYAQLLPDVTPPYTTGQAKIITLTKVISDEDFITFTQKITPELLIARGFARIWVDSVKPITQVISQFSSEGGSWPGACRRCPKKYRPKIVRPVITTGPVNGRPNVVALKTFGAPMYSDDGGVAIFNTSNLHDNIYGFVQALPDAPEIPSWLTPIGQAYGIAITPTLKNGSILFSYFERDVPLKQEEWLNIYAYTPNNLANVATSDYSWKLLDTTLSITNNLAAAKLDPNAQIYALMSSVPIPLKVGWNNFGYLNPASQGVITAMASISDAYTAVYGYNPTTQQWQMFDKNVFLTFSNALSINTLTHLEFGRGYWVNVAKPITLYFATDVNGSANTPRLPFMEILPPNPNFPTPPAIFYGWITPTAVLPVNKQSKVTAWMNGQLCGSASVQELKGKWTYILSLNGDGLADTPQGCGVLNKPIEFKIDRQKISSISPKWSNTQANFVSLTELASICNDVIGDGTMEKMDSTWVLNQGCEAVKVASFLDKNNRSLLFDWQSKNPTCKNPSDGLMWMSVYKPIIIPPKTQTATLSLKYSFGGTTCLATEEKLVIFYTGSRPIDKVKLPCPSFASAQWQTITQTINLNNMSNTAQNFKLYIGGGNSPDINSKMFVDDVTLCVANKP